MIEMSKSMFDTITEVICKGERMTPEAVRQNCRDVEIVYPRQLIMYFAREFRLGSLTAIGKPFGKDHATVFHSVKVINDYLITDKAKREQIEEYRNKLNGIEKVSTVCESLRKEVVDVNNQITEAQNKVLTLQISIREADEMLDKLNI